MAIKRNATAVWNGSGKDGNGNLTTASQVLNQSQYSYATRFENGTGTNPEELIAAAHAGCFSMKLAFNLQAAGLIPQEIKTSCEIVLDQGSITASNLTLNATVPGASAQQFNELVNDAKANCPISKLLNTEITLSYSLNN